ncbi:MAG: Gfo/Idh/MocA family oxidoreductase [Clostridia bacterium]|nr:Gfo/Idh/MocA family oxidoreductase [Clostridia bacterium]
MIKAAIIGFGGIAQAAHLPPYIELEKQGKAKLVAVCDIDPKRFEAKMSINLGDAQDTLPESVHRYTDWHEMLKNEDVDMVDVCLPTFLHAETAIELLNSGYHVLSEKPMSLCYEDCLRMCEAAKTNDKKLMIGQCIRFNGNYNFIKEAVEDGRFGKLKTGTFRRLSSPPIWGWDNWFMDYERSHGCMWDLHIHDLDFVQHMLGLPQAVSCTTQDVYSGRDICHSKLHYGDFAISVVGDWSLEGMPFVADFVVSFEKATLELRDGKLLVHPRDGETYSPDVDTTDFYFKEIDFFVDTIANGTENVVNRPESAAMSIKIAEELCRSSDLGGQVLPFKA